MKLALLGDCDSPHMLKWARALAPRVELWAASTRGFAVGFDAAVPLDRRLALNTRARFEGGNIGVLRELPKVARWLGEIGADWIHAHYLTSHGTLAWLAKLGWRVPGRLVGSAWGSDILVTPERNMAMRWVTSRVLKACDLTTSDSVFMAERMRALGAREVMTFPFGLESMPPAPAAKDDRLFFTNRGLEPLYAPQRALEVFAAVAAQWPDAQLVVANDGSMRGALQRLAQAKDLDSRVRFVGRLNPGEQSHWYGRARWYLSVPASDSVSVSVLEAMAHGCVPILSDLPANRELVRDRDNGLIVTDGADALVQALEALQPRADEIGRSNRAWVAGHAVFPLAVERFLARLNELQDAP
jgi:L-malate glycosyltransferase